MKAIKISVLTPPYLIHIPHPKSEPEFFVEISDAIAEYPEFGDGSISVWGNDKTMRELDKAEEEYEYLDFEPANNDSFYRELLKKLAFPKYGYNTRILIDPDKNIIEMPNNEFFENENIFVAEFRSPGYWNEDTSIYLDGWTEELPDGRFRSVIDGKILTLEDAIASAIEEGEWTDTFDEFHTQIYEQSIGKLARGL